MYMISTHVVREQLSILLVAYMYIHVWQSCPLLVRGIYNLRTFKLKYIIYGYYTHARSPLDGTFKPITTGRAIYYMKLSNFRSRTETVMGQMYGHGP